MKIRSPIKVFLLSIITLGVYDLYWLVKTKNALNKETSKHTPTIWLLFIPLIIFVITVVFMIFSSASSNNGASSSYYSGSTASNGLVLNTSGTGTTTSVGSGSTGVAVSVIVMYIVLFLSFLTVVPYWFFKFSKSVNEYTHGRMSTAVSFMSLWIVHFIGVALVQDAINDTLEGGGGHAVPPAPSASSGNPVAYTPPSDPATPPTVPSVNAPQQPVTPSQNAVPTNVDPQQSVQSTQPPSMQLPQTSPAPTEQAPQSYGQDNSASQNDNSNSQPQQ